MPSPEDFDYPRLNATLNAIAFLFLIAGFVSIKSGKKRAHIVCMISALITSTAFLVSYLTYHYLTEGIVTKFPTEYAGARKVYLTILITHIPLAALLVPLVIMTVIPAFRERFDRHRRLARITLPIWLYVSVTGVLIYMMLYRWYLPMPVESTPDQAAAGELGQQQTLVGPETLREEEAAETAGGAELTFSPAVCKINAKATDEIVTARYEVTNNSDQSVSITDLDTSCDCLDVRSNKSEIGAGETVFVEADFTLQKLVGTAQKTVIVRTDHPDHQEARLAVEVTVDPIYEIEPLTLVWTVGEDPEPKEIVFKVVRDEPIKITGMHATRESSFTSALRAVTPGREYRIVLTPKSTEKEILGFVRVETDCEIEKYATELMYFRISREEETDKELTMRQDQSKSPGKPVRK